MDVKEESILGSAIENHWYYLAKGAALRQFLGGYQVPEVLDVGAGSGVFAKQLLDHELADRAVCVDPEYAQERTEVHNGSEIEFVRGLNQVTQRLVLMMDVLEHVDDDLGLLTSYVNRIPKGGRVLITVPAFQFLWSGHDVFLEHRRRYTLRELERLVELSGLRVINCKYFFATVLPLVAALRIGERVLKPNRLTTGKSHLRPASPLENAILNYVNRFEQRILFPINRLAGLSLFCLAQHP